MNYVFGVALSASVLFKAEKLLELVCNFPKVIR